MYSLSGFRPPQFSEESTWLPSWLQRCEFQQLNVNSIEQGYDMFEHRVEDLQLLQKNVDGGKLSEEEGGCNIGHLFLSGTDISSFSLAPPNDSVAECHLCLSSDGNTENTNLTASAYQSESKRPFIVQRHENSAILSKASVRLSLFNSGETMNSSEKVELQTSTIENQLLKDDENSEFLEAATDAVELCVAASEALVINEIIESDSVKASSASAVLEASLRLKQARWEVCDNTFSCSMNEAFETENLCDLDDRNMETAYEDAGICIDELHVNELSISLVKDTPDPNRDENLEHEITASVSIRDGSYYGSPHKMECNEENDYNIMDEDRSGDCVHGDSQKKLTGSEELKMRRAVAGTSLPKSNLSSSPVTSKNDQGKHNSFSCSVDEKFQSRWFGGWSHDPPQNKATCTTGMKHNIQQPFVAQTSFLSESDAAAPDEISFVRNHDQRDVIASQLSVPSEKYFNSPKDGVLLTQDQGTSLSDPLCSVVPCSIPDSSTSLPTYHENRVPPTVFNNSKGCTKVNEVDITSNDKLIQGELIDMVIPDTEESCRGISRRFTSLRNYSKILPARANFLAKDDNQKDSLLINNNPNLIFKVKDLTNQEEFVRVGTKLPVLQKEDSFPGSLVVNRAMHRHFRNSTLTQNHGNPSQTASSEINSKVLPSKNLQWPPLQCITKSMDGLPSSKRVRFSEEEITTSQKDQDAQNISNTCIVTRTTKFSTRSSPHLEFRVKKSNRIPKSHLRKEKNSRLIFQNMEFLLTGFSKEKEYEIESLIREHGGIVLSRIPSTSFKGNSSLFKHETLPILLCLKKVQSFKFLYGCAVNAFILKVNWLIDSIAAGVDLPPEKYMILSRNISRSRAQNAENSEGHSLVFSSFGVMIHGKTKYLNNMATIVKHGGGQVFKTFQELLHAVEAGKISKGVVVSDDVSCGSRHLKHYALEKNIPVTSVSWIIKSLYSGQLVPLEDTKHSLPQPSKLRTCQNVMDLCQEI